MTGDTGTVYDYDLNGNVIGKSIANRNEKGSTDYTYSYSLSGLLTTVTKNGETVQENVYDAENIRSGRHTITDDGSAEEIFATLAGKLIAALRAETSNNPQEEWEEEPRKVSVKSLKSSNPYKRNFIYGNGLEKIGDFTAITNSHGDVKKLVGAKLETVAAYVYDAFGNLLNDQINEFETISYTTTGSDTGFFNDILYAGEQYDCVTGTYYLRARTYSPSLGRFLEEDTYLGDGRNLYTYVSNNPVMFVDPSGYCKQDWNRVGEGTFKMVWGSVITSAGITSLIVVAEVLSGPVGWVALAISVGVGAAGALCVGFGVSDSLEGV